MKNIHTMPFIRAVLITGALLLTACTPQQLKTYQQVTGDQLSVDREASLLALEDNRMKLGDGSIIELDGSVTIAPPIEAIKARINTLTYTYTEPAPAMEAFRAVAAARGWSQAQIDSWAVAVQDIMHFESGFCPNVLGGARMASGEGCVISRQGRRGDAGFGQLISLHYRGWLCTQESLCSKWDVIATPWSSMTALVALIERSGTSGYCYSSFARRLHRTTCSNPGLDV